MSENKKKGNGELFLCTKGSQIQITRSQKRDMLLKSNVSFERGAETRCGCLGRSS